MTARECYEAGQLDEAVAAALAEVKAAPGDIGKRAFLADLSCLAGDIERADRQLDMLVELDPKAAVGCSLYRQLIRAEQHRQQCFGEGRVPEFLHEPSVALKTHLEATILAREGKLAEAAVLVARAEDERPKVAGTCDGKAFGDFRDCDDVTASFFEVLTSTGKYYWVPFEKIEAVELRKPERVRDLLWRRARMVVRDGGPDGEVYLPCLYVGSAKEGESALRLGRATDWRGGDGSPVRGAGLRTFLAGDDAVTLHQMNEIAFDG